MSEATKSDQFEVTVFSFGFKHGQPEKVTTMFDVRFLPNPYWEEGMRHKSGREKDVSDYVIESEAGKEFLEKVETLLASLIEWGMKAGKKELILGVGCTGGRHRSVAVVEQLGKLLQTTPVKLNLYHRDLERD